MQKGFWGLLNLTSISIPATVEDIGDAAFANCIKLKSISLPDKVISISNETFYACETLSSVKFGKNVTSIGDYAFAECYNLGNITLPNTLQTMGDYAFQNCTYLGKISIPAKCKVISNHAFDGCVSLSSVTLNEGVTKVGNEAFDGCPINSISFPKTLGSIGEYAFRDTSLKTITFKGATPVDNINERAFVQVNNAKGYYPYGSNTVLLDSLKNKFTGNQNSWPSYANIVWYNSAKTSIAKATVTGISNKTYTGKAITQNPTVKVGSKTLKKGTDYTLSYSNNIKVGTATVTITGKGSYTGEIKKTFKITTARKKPTLRRLYGNDRFGTAYKISEAYIKDSKQSKLNNVIVVNGTNKSFPDALSATYLSAKYKAPIILTDNAATQNKAVVNWVKENMRNGKGNVYFVGGNLVLSESLKSEFKNAGYTVERVAGNDRIGTNIASLKNVGVKNGSEMLVSDGWDPYTSLIASATGKPVLLVQKGGLTKEQKSFLKNKNLKFTLIGDTSKVSSTVESNLKSYGTIKQRIKAGNLDSLSVAVAKKYWPKGPSEVFLARNETTFADSLSGGSECIYFKGPLLLVSEKSHSASKKYVNGLNTVKRITVFGGPLAISDKLAKSIQG